MTADWPDDADKPYVPQYQVATQKVMAYITENRLAPGDRLPTERQLAELLGMSHTVVREAVKVLSATGRVRVRKRAGLIVDEPNSEIVTPANNVFSPTQSDQVEQLFDYRRIIEAEAAQLAASNGKPAQITAISEWSERSEQAAERGEFAEFRAADGGFHRSVAVASNNVFVVRAADAIEHYKARILRVGLRGNASGSLTEAARQHLAISAAISRGDAESAAQLSRGHAEIAKRQYLARIQDAIDALDAASQAD